MTFQQVLKRVAPLSVPLLILCSPSVAQRDAPHFDVFGGYSYSGFTQQFASNVGFNGWNATFKYRPEPLFAAVADFGGSYATANGFSRTTYTYLFGPEVTLPGSRVSPFAHALFGGGHMTSSLPSRSVFAFALGGGVDVRLKPRLAWRSQIDYLYGQYHVSDNQSPYPDSRYRFSTGLAFHF
jgi:hypothetical protein